MAPAIRGRAAARRARMRTPAAPTRAARWCHVSLACHPPFARCHGAAALLVGPRCVSSCVPIPLDALVERIFDGRDWLDTGPGDYCFVPEGGIHGFRNESGEAASMLILFAPGAPREQYFEGLREMFRPGREVSAEEFTEFCERHDNIYL